MRDATLGATWWKWLERTLKTVRGGVPVGGVERDMVRGGVPMGGVAAEDARSGLGAGMSTGGVGGSGTVRCCGVERGVPLCSLGRSRIVPEWHESKSACAEDCRALVGIRKEMNAKSTVSRQPLGRLLTITLRKSCKTASAQSRG